MSKHCKKQKSLRPGIRSTEHLHSGSAKQDWLRPDTAKREQATQLFQRIVNGDIVRTPLLCLVKGKIQINRDDASPATALKA